MPPADLSSRGTKRRKIQNKSTQPPICYSLPMCYFPFYSIPITTLLPFSDILYTLGCCPHLLLYSLSCSVISWLPCWRHVTDASLQLDDELKYLTHVFMYVELPSSPPDPSTSLNFSSQSSSLQRKDVPLAAATRDLALPTVTSIAREKGRKISGNLIPCISKLSKNKVQI